MQIPKYECGKEPPIIGVRFWNPERNEYFQKVYTYYCPFPVKIGDIVIVPMTNTPPRQEVIVAEVNVDPNTVNPNRLKDLRTVIGRKVNA